MQKRQSALGTHRVVHVKPSYVKSRIGKIRSVRDYQTKGFIEVQFLNYGLPFPVWVVGDLDREPSEGDMVVIGYMEGRKDAPYLAGFVRNQSVTSNYIVVTEDTIRFQLPIDSKDKTGHMLDDSKLSTRAYIEVTANQITLNHPKKVAINGATIDINGTTVDITGTPVTINGTTF